MINMIIYVYVVYTWALTALLHHHFGVCVCAVTVFGPCVRPRGSTKQDLQVDFKSDLSHCQHWTIQGYFFITAGSFNFDDVLSVEQSWFDYASRNPACNSQERSD